VSSHWTVYCVECEVYGPDIRRSGSVSLQGFWPRRHPMLTHSPPPTSEEAKLAWESFLDKHEWHKLELVHE